MTAEVPALIMGNNIERQEQLSKINACFLHYSANNYRSLIATLSTLIKIELACFCFVILIVLALSTMKSFRSFHCK